MNETECMDWAAYRRAQIRWRRWLASNEGRLTLRRLRRRAELMAIARTVLVVTGWVTLATVAAVALTALAAWW